MASSSGSEFPWQHSFPPFYTLQPHAETREKQLSTWCDIVLDYCRRRNLTTVDIGNIVNSPLFVNAGINRRVDPEFLSVLFDRLAAKGNLEWTDKSKKRALIFFKSPDEWATLIYNHAKDRGLVSNTVCTFYELTEGSEATNQPFFGIATDLLIKSLKTLEKRGKAEIFADDEGVKFFQ